MHDWESLSHVRWECKYHVAVIPKYRRKVFFGRLRRQIGPILRELCRQKGVTGWAFQQRRAICHWGYRRVSDLRSSPVSRQCLR